MAKKAARKAARRKTARPKRSIEVRVPIPERAKISVTDLKKLKDDEIADLLKAAKTAKVGFVILNAPFKVRPADPVS